ncbi:MAG: Dabb family protein [Planctomycetota bacterium]|nr:MAG: Dabb family protein [Planctomycetota bacterium]
MSQVKHFGVFLFKPTISAAHIDHCFAEMRGMVGKIPGLLEMSHGPYQSPESMHDGFTHGFIMTFESAAARDAYLPHPEHERVRQIVVPSLERVVVFDFAVLPEFRKTV